MDLELFQFSTSGQDEGQFLFARPSRETVKKSFLEEKISQNKFCCCCSYIKLTTVQI